LFKGLLRPEHGTLYRYISVRQPSADNSSSLGSKLISSNVPTYDFYLRELLRSEFTYLITKMKQRTSGQEMNLDFLSPWPAQGWGYKCKRNLIIYLPLMEKTVHMAVNEAKRYEVKTKTKTDKVNTTNDTAKAKVMRPQQRPEPHGTGQGH